MMLYLFLLVVRSSYRKSLSDKDLCVCIMSNIAFHNWNRGEYRGRTDDLLHAMQAL